MLFGCSVRVLVNKVKIIISIFFSLILLAGVFVALFAFNNYDPHPSDAKSAKAALFSADVNGDGVVSTKDYVLWFKKDKRGDLNQDGKIDGKDYVILLKNISL